MVTRVTKPKLLSFKVDHLRSNDGRVTSASNSFWFHDHIPLLIPAADHGTCPADRGAQDHRDPLQKRTLQRSRPLLGQDLRDQFPHRRGDWHSDGISVWHELVAIL